jgi:AhpC/TSA family
MCCGRCGAQASLLLLAIVSACLISTVPAAARQSAFALDGKPLNPLATNSRKAIVLVFLRRDCPVSSRYAPVIQQISARYQREANFWLVYPDRTDSPKQIREHLRDYGYRLPALRDPGHVLVKLGHVHITPEVAVFDRDHRLVYDGRIDDWYVEFGRSRPAPTTHELEDAIRAALGGKSVAQNEVRGVGCYISDLE